MKNSTSRIRLVAVIFVAVALLFVVRLFFIQVIRGSDYAEQADRQYLRPANNIFERGSIFFTTKDGTMVSAASLKVGFIVAANPQKITNASTTYEQLAVMLPDLNREKTIQQLSDRADPYVEIATRVDQTIADQIKASKISGIDIYKQKWRFYPAGPAAAHAIGFMGYKGDLYSGRYGLEKQYDSLLTRNKDGLFVNFFAELFSEFASSTQNTATGAEGDIVLTIEPLVQNALEKELTAYVEKWQPDMVAGIIINPQNGEIYAMAGRPNFDPGEKQTNIEALNNKMVEKTYEMGSIFKPLTIAAALDTGVVTASTTYNDKGCLTLNKKKFCNFDGKARGVIPVQEILNQSLNVGSTFVMQRLGAERFRSYFHAYGFSEKTGIDLPDEASGQTASLDGKPREIDLANMSFGQGIAITPMEMARALSVLGNGGRLIRPHLVRQINHKNLLTETIPLEPGQQIIKPETSAEISRMLTVVVDTKLADGKVKMAHYRIAAKTGTAQIYNLANGGYYDDRNLHSFFGYFPASKPQFLIFLMSVYPKGAAYSSQTLTDPFISLNRFLINYYQVPPDR